jgi:hypothetical protein
VASIWGWPLVCRHQKAKAKSKKQKAHSSFWQKRRTLLTGGSTNERPPRNSSIKDAHHPIESPVVFGNVVVRRNNGFSIN